MIGRVLGTALCAGALLWPAAAAAGTIEVNSTGYTGDFGAEVEITDQAVTFVQDDSPNGEKRYVARFYVRNTELQMASGDAFDLFSGYNTTSDAQFRIRIRKDTTLDELRLRAAVRLDDGSFVENSGNEILLPVGWRAIEVDWEAATAPGADDGYLAISLDGVDQGLLELEGLDNDQGQIDFVRWGAVDGIDPGTAVPGSKLNLDDFDSRRNAPIGLLTAFGDVPLNGFWPFIHAIYHSEITAGCGGGNFCPDASVTRAQMAVFVLVAKEGPLYSPPPCTTSPFDDVPAGSGFCPWIQELADRGIVAGCGGGNYCPNDPVSRQQMSVFLLATLEGSGYTPPACTVAPFDDVPVESGFCPWIQELANRGITAGCGGGNYCPNDPNLRKQMAVFLTATFSLPVPQAPTP